MKRIAFALAVTFAMMLPFSPAIGEERRRVIEIDEPRPQVPLKGEVRKEKLNKDLFYSKVRPILTEEQLLTSGYISVDDRPYGSIIDSSIEKRLSAGDVVFINRGKPDGVKMGDSFYIYRRIKEVMTIEDEDEVFGHLISIIGEMKVIEVMDKSSSIQGEDDSVLGEFNIFGNGDEQVTGVSAARITKGFLAIEKGDLFIPKYNIYVPTMDMDRPVKEKKISGRIIAVGHMDELGANNSTVYLNVGRKNGVEEGDVFGIYDSPLEETADYKFGYEERIGSGKVVMVKEKSATLVITNSLREIPIHSLARFVQER